MGKIDANCGLASYKYIEACAKLALSNQIDAIATSPINKESLKAGKVDFIGHTEILAHLTKANDPLTMFEVDGLRVFFLSRHVSLRQACDMVKKERIIDYVKRCTDALKLIGVEGTFAIAGLNPHSGENGLFGWEEVNEIRPAILQLIGDGYDVVGPVPADSVFYHGLNKKYSAILSLYHDQGHIATKTYDFHRTIAVTHGMPILRTSVDHGTAFDIAGKNIADPISMIEATKLAAQYASYFNSFA
jgi:4-hydroxythreonine-4-phosphate dehydrogenase